MNSKKDRGIGLGILPTDVYFQYTTVRKLLGLKICDLT